MFTIHQILEAHSKVKSGADFPAYVQALIKLGVTNYSTFVNDGNTVYKGADNHVVSSDAKYDALEVADESDSEKFKNDLKIHQQGKTDYMGFCRDSAAAGVEKWTVDTVEMTCIYYNKTGHVMLLETIPVP